MVDLSDSSIKRISFTLFVLGWVVIGVVAIFLPTYIQHLKNSTVQESLVVDGYDDDDYKDWLTSTDKDDIPTTYFFTFFNIENPDEILQNSNQQSSTRYRLSMLGPYGFREYCNKYNVSFPEDAKYSKYHEYCWYEYDEISTNKDGKNLDPYKDEITSINPVYVTLATSFGGESNIDLLLHLICYVIPNTFPDAVNCNRIGIPRPDGSVIPMSSLFGITFPDLPPEEGLLKKIFISSYKFRYGIGGGSGLFVTRTPEEWIYFQNTIFSDSETSTRSSVTLPFFDPLLYLLHYTPESTINYLEQLSGITVPNPLVAIPAFGYSSNITLQQFFASGPEFIMRYTGKDDLDNLNKYKMWEGNEYIYRKGDPRGPNKLSGGRSFEGWQSEIQVDGIHSASRFKPDPKEEDLFTCWLSDGIRHMHFYYQEKTKTEVGDIDVIRYVSSPEDFYNVKYNPTNAIFYHWEDNPNYIAPYEPLTGLKLWAGKPYFWNSPLFSYESHTNPYNKIDFLDGVPQNWLEFETLAYIEPLWGLALEGKQQIQFSVNITSSPFDLSGPNLVHAWVPTLIQNNQVDLNKAKADDYNDASDSYKYADTASELCVIFGCLFGIILFGCSAFLFSVFWRRRISEEQKVPLKSIEMTEIPQNQELNLLYSS